MLKDKPDVHKILPGTFRYRLRNLCNSRIYTLPFVFFAPTEGRSPSYLPFTLTSQMRRHIMNYSSSFEKG
jgi:hypothetical protein